MKKTVIFAGGFGSGKSEIALNYTFKMNNEQDKLILADLDLVNPYFAARDIKNSLEKNGIRVVAPEGDLSFGDVPSIPAEMIGLLRDNNNIIIDLAGDEVGSLVLGYLSKFVIKRGDYDLFLVINPYRPFAQDIESLIELKMLLEGAAHIQFTGIISNPNLMEETTTEIIRKGHKMVENYAKSLNLPVSYLIVERKFYQELFSEYGKTLKEINLYLRSDWF